MFGRKKTFTFEIILYLDENENPTTEITSKFQTLDVISVKEKTQIKAENELKRILELKYPILIEYLYYV